MATAPSKAYRLFQCRGAAMRVAPRRINPGTFIGEPSRILGMFNCHHCGNIVPVLRWQDDDKIIYRVVTHTNKGEYDDLDISGPIRSASSVMDQSVDPRAEGGRRESGSDPRKGSAVGF